MQLKKSIVWFIAGYLLSATIIQGAGQWTNRLPQLIRAGRSILSPASIPGGITPAALRKEAVDESMRMGPIRPTERLAPQIQEPEQVLRAPVPAPRVTPEFRELRRDASRKPEPIARASGSGTKLPSRFFAQPLRKKTGWNEDSVQKWAESQRAGTSGQAASAFSSGFAISEPKSTPRMIEAKFPSSSAKAPKKSVATKPRAKTPKKPGQFVNPARLKSGSLPAYIPVSYRNYAQREVYKNLVAAGVPKGKPRALARKTVYPKIGQGLIEKTVSGELQTGLPLPLLSQAAKQSPLSPLTAKSVVGLKKAPTSRPSSQRGPVAKTQAKPVLRLTSRKPNAIAQSSQAVVPVARVQHIERAASPASQSTPGGIISTVGGQPVDSQFLSRIKAGTLKPDIVVRYKPGLNGVPGDIILDELNMHGFYDTTVLALNKFKGGPNFQKAIENLVRAGKETMYAFYQPKKLQEIGSRASASSQTLVPSANSTQAKFGDPLQKLLDIMQNAKTAVVKIFEPQKIQTRAVHAQNLFSLEDAQSRQESLQRISSAGHAIKTIEQKTNIAGAQISGTPIIESELARQLQELREMQKIVQLLKSPFASSIDLPAVTKLEQAIPLGAQSPMQAVMIPRIEPLVVEPTRDVETPVSINPPMPILIEQPTQPEPTVDEISHAGGSSPIVTLPEHEQPSNELVVPAVTTLEQAIPSSIQSPVQAVMIPSIEPLVVEPTWDVEIPVPVNPPMPILIEQPTQPEPTVDEISHAGGSSPIVTLPEHEQPSNELVVPAVTTLEQAIPSSIQSPVQAVMIPSIEPLVVEPTWDVEIPVPVNPPMPILIEQPTQPEPTVEEISHAGGSLPVVTLSEHERPSNELVVPAATTLEQVIPSGMQSSVQTVMIPHIEPGDVEPTGGVEIPISINPPMPILIEQPEQPELTVDEISPAGGSLPVVTLPEHDRMSNEPVVPVVPVSDEEEPLIQVEPEEPEIYTPENLEQEPELTETEPENQNVPLAIELPDDPMQKHRKEILNALEEDQAIRQIVVDDFEENLLNIRELLILYNNQVTIIRALHAWAESTAKQQFRAVYEDVKRNIREAFNRRPITP